jgi:nitrate/nitrite-specific signal transduction histidine kinase
MSNEKNSEKKGEENPFLKGWNDFVSGIKGGFENFQKTLEDQSKKAVEDWEKSGDNVNKFFNNMSENWNKQFAKWRGDIEKAQIENQEEWEATTAKIKTDIEKWQDETRKDWKDGVKTWNRSVVKGAYMFLIVMVPVIIVLVLVIWVITQFLNLVPT